VLYRALRLPRSCRRFSIKEDPGLILYSQLIEREPFAYDLSNSSIESVAVSEAFAVIVTERLLIEIAEKMEGFYADVRT
jgi:hypothetical protein